MSLEETASYIDHGLEVAHRKAKLFSDATKMEIFKRTNGITRQIHRIGHNTIVAIQETIVASRGNVCRRGASSVK